MLAHQCFVEAVHKDNSKEKLRPSECPLAERTKFRHKLFPSIRKSDTSKWKPASGQQGKLPGGVSDFK